VAGRISSIEKSNDLIGNRTRDLPACSVVPQPTTLQRAPPSGALLLTNLLCSWDVTPYSLLNRSKHFRETCSLNSTLKMGAACPSETLVPTYQAMQHHIPEHHNLMRPIHDQSCCAKLFCATQVCPFTIKSISTIHGQS
jgi:hypothetical protein